MEVGEKTIIKRRLTYLAGFWLTAHMALAAYINSTFLQGLLFDEKLVGLVFAVGSFLAILGILSATSLLNKFGARYSLIGFSGFGLLASALLAFWPSRSIGLVFIFIIYYASGFLSRFFLDVYLEKLSDDSETGLIRALFLTAANVAWIISPFIAGLLLTNGDNWKIYAVSGACLLPLLFIASRYLTERRVPGGYARFRAWRKLGELLSAGDQKSKNILNILLVDFGLNFFYALMVIYSPIYLYNHIGLTWSQIGLIFSIMHIPFLFFQLPLGQLADRRLGEKEILVVGLIIIILATASLSIPTMPVFWLWATIFFLTRTGASAIEVAKESYLFKMIGPEDSEVIALSRINLPLAYMIVPIITSFFFFFFSFRLIFIFLALAVSVSLIPASRLVDTR